MTTTITLQLPDEIAQRLQIEAQEQNTTPENVAAQHLVQTLRSNSSIHQSFEKTDEHLGNDNPLAQLFNRIYEANQAGQDRIQAKITPLTRQIADSLLKQQLVTQIEIDETQADTMILYLPEGGLPVPEYGQNDYLQNFRTDNPRLQQILEKLRDPDPNVRIQGVTALGDFACELT
jgi:hypothetical protein